MIDGAWYLVDVTWGAGNLEDGRFNRQFNPAYFATAPTQLIYSHHPTLDRWQLLPQPYDRQQFLAMPRLKPEFFEYGLALQDATQYRLRAATGRAKITLKAPPNVIFTASLKQNKQTLDETQTFVQRNGDRVEINMAFPAAGTYQLEIYAKPQQAKAKQLNKQTQQSYQLPLVASYELIATQSGAAFPKTYATYAEKRAYLRTPIAATLPRNQSVALEILVPNALEVAAIDQQTQQWTKLQKQGDLFVGIVKTRGTLSVTAKFAGSEDYWSLVTYQ
jgi:transglutaminase/protease-like cytokinesis protein 3